MYSGDCVSYKSFICAVSHEAEIISFIFNMLDNFKLTREIKSRRSSFNV